MGRRNRKRSERGKNEKAAELTRLQAGLKVEREPTIVRDDLDPEESLALEMRSLREDWVSSDSTFASLRKTLAVKVARDAIKTTDPLVRIAAYRALSTTEQRQRRLMLQAISLQLRKPPKPGDIPEPEEAVADDEGTVSVAGMDFDEISSSEIGEQVEEVVTLRAYQVVQALIGRKEVRSAFVQAQGKAQDVERPAVQVEASSQASE